MVVVAATVVVGVVVGGVVAAVVVALASAFRLGKSSRGRKQPPLASATTCICALLHGEIFFAFAPKEILGYIRKEPPSMSIGRRGHESVWVKM